MYTLHGYAIFEKPTQFGQAHKLLGFTRDNPETADLIQNGHLALSLDTTLATEVATSYQSEHPEWLKELEHAPKAIIIEGSLWETGVVAYGPFVNAQEARRHAWKLDSISRTMILSLEHPDRELFQKNAVNVKRLREESALYHDIMQDLQNLKLPHGRCQPRSDRACTHCNAQDRLDNALTEYLGPPIVCS